MYCHIVVLHIHWKVEDKKNCDWKFWSALIWRWDTVTVLRWMECDRWNNADVIEFPSDIPLLDWGGNRRNRRAGLMEKMNRNVSRDCLFAIFCISTHWSEWVWSTLALHYIWHFQWKSEVKHQEKYYATKCKHHGHLRNRSWLTSLHHREDTSILEIGQIKKSTWRHHNIDRITIKYTYTARTSAVCCYGKKKFVVKVKHTLTVARKS